jgi:hypothetical protein
MITVVGIVGFVCGFAFGQMLLLFLLRHKTKAELLNDKNLRRVYGLLNWGIAVLGCYSAIEMYKFYFS